MYKSNVRWVQIIIASCHMSINAIIQGIDSF